MADNTANAPEERDADELGEEFDDEIDAETQALLDKYRQEYGRIGAWDVPDMGILIVAKKRGATGRKIYNTFQSEWSNKSLDKSVTCENFVLKSTVHPDRETARRMLEEYPGIATLASAELQDLYGSDAKNLGKLSGRRART